MSLVRLTVFGMAVLSGGLALAQDRPDGQHLVTITVAEDRPYALAHEIRIEAETYHRPQSQEDLDRRVWRATRVSVRGEEHLSSGDCPQLRQAALAFGALPDLPFAPPMASVNPDPTSLLPTMKDGYSTRLNFRIISTDGSEAVVDMRGGNTYARWANDTVGTLNGCWPPLRP